MKMRNINLKFIFFKATRVLSLKFFTPLCFTLKDFNKSLFLMCYNKRLKDTEQ